MRQIQLLLLALLPIASYAATLESDGFVREWLVCGPFPNSSTATGYAGYSIDFLDGEAWVCPKVGDEKLAEFVADMNQLVAEVGSSNEWGFKSTQTFKAKWAAIHSDSGIVSLNRCFLPIDDYFVAYAVSYLTVEKDCKVTFLVGSDDDHKLYLNSQEIGGSQTSQGVLPGEFKYSGILLKKGINRVLLKICDRDSDCGFCLQVWGSGTRKAPCDVHVETDPGAGKTIVEEEFERENTPERIKGKWADLEHRKLEAERRLNKLLPLRDSLRQEVSEKLEKLREEERDVEKYYSEIHERAAALGMMSESIPLKPEERRSVLCLNGIWEAKIKGRDWTHSRLPNRMLSCRNAPKVLPVHNVDPKNRYSRVEPNSGFEDIADLDVITADKARFRTKFKWDGDGAVLFRADAVIGRAVVLVNGVRCGDYDGIVGIWRVPLQGLKLGENVLELEIERTKIGYNKWDSSGFRGDLYLEFVPLARVTETCIKTSWRKSRIDVKVAITNDCDASSEVEVRVRAVKDGMIKLSLPSNRVELAAKAGIEVTTGCVWKDPEIWGIGGCYGRPEEYELVVDILRRGVVVDRYRESFGFREFWSHAMHFYLNGRKIMLTGDVSHIPLNYAKIRSVFWPLLRGDGINTQRYHDNDYWSVSAISDADRMGMLSYLQCYPTLEADADDFNKANYLRWWKTFRNHPSVVVWSVDNEICTQTKAKSKELQRFAKLDRDAAAYGKWLKELDPEIIVTRDGDMGTWRPSEDSWLEGACDAANYHYPDYSLDLVRHWRDEFAYRPVIFGETLYCAYGAFDQNVGAIPAQIHRKAEKVRRVVGLYVAEDVPASIFMGLGLDGFVCLDNTGNGNPWGHTEQDRELYEREGRLPSGFAVDGYPWMRIEWPSLSGAGERVPAVNICNRIFGCRSVNWFNAKCPSHVRNEVNDAYRDSLPAQPALQVGALGEIIVEASPFVDVWSFDEQAVCRGVRADSEGRAWFRSLRPGRVKFCANGYEAQIIGIERIGAVASKPGFDSVKAVKLKRSR